MRGRYWGMALSALALACAAGQGGQPNPRADSREPREAQRSTATWSYHPGPARFSLAALPVEGGVLHVTAEGERWVVSPDGRATPSHAFAGDVLSDAVRSDTGYVFLTSTGAGHFARTPLGPFETTRRPPDGAVKVRLGGQTVLALLADGALVLAAVESWHFAAAVVGTRIADVGFDGADGLAIVVPESIQSSSDSGASWQSVDVEPFGAFRVQQSARGGLEVAGARGRRAWDAKAKVFGPLDHSPEQPRPVRAGTIVPDLSAFARGHAVIAGDRYFEIRGGSAWQLVEGTLGGPFTAAPLRERASPGEFEPCWDFSVAAFGRFLSLACVEPEAVRLFGSSDGGRRFSTQQRIARPTEPARASPPVAPAPMPARPEPRAHRGRLKLPSSASKPSAGFFRGVSKPKIVAGRGGAIVLQPTCGPASTDCSPNRLLLRRAHGTGLEDWPMAQTERVGGVTFSADGGVAFALTCEPWRNELYLRRAEPGKNAFGFARVETGARACDLVEELVSLSSTEDGRVAVVHGRKVPVSRVLRADGFWETSPVRLETAASHSWAGSRGLRVFANGAVDETLDAGAHFRRVTKLGFPVCADNACTMTTVCAHAGCLVGDSLTRRGWGADDAPPTSAPTITPVSTRRKERERPAWGGVIRCVTGDQTWAETPAAPRPSTFGMTTNAWLAIASSGKGGASVVRGLDAPRLRVDSRPMFAAPAGKPAGSGLWTDANELGVAAMRLEHPTDGAEVLSLAWQAAERNQLVRQHLRVPLAKSEIIGRGRRNPWASVQTTAGGVYVRWREHTLFADGRVTRDVLAAGPAGEMVRFQGQDIGIAAGGNTLQAVLHDAAGPAHRVLSVGSVSGPDFGVSTTLVSWEGRPGFAVEYARPNPEAMFFPVLASGAFGAAEALAMPPSSPVACTPRQRASTPRRLVAIDYRIVVSGPDEPEATYRGSAMLQGPADAGCVSFLVAQNSLEPSVRRLFLDLSAPGRAWLFDHGKLPMATMGPRERDTEPAQPVRFRPLRCELAS
ncbi:MAG: hypothetical protein HYZ29_30595 [Myxococcales bacterium]|nr:hypothetical protein [Myxococcales bacterium]